MTQQVEVRATRPHDLSLTPQTHMVENWLPHVTLWTLGHAHAATVIFLPSMWLPSVLTFTWLMAHPLPLRHNNCSTLRKTDIESRRYALNEDAIWTSLSLGNERGRKLMSKILQNSPFGCSCDSFIQSLWIIRNMCLQKGELMLDENTSRQNLFIVYLTNKWTMCTYFKLQQWWTESLVMGTSSQEEQSRPTDLNFCTGHVGCSGWCLGLDSVWWDSISDELCRAWKMEMWHQAFTMCHSNWEQSEQKDPP